MLHADRSLSGCALFDSSRAAPVGKQSCNVLHITIHNVNSTLLARAQHYHKRCSIFWQRPCLQVNNSINSLAKEWRLNPALSAGLHTILPESDPLCKMSGEYTDLIQCCEIWKSTTHKIRHPALISIPQIGLGLAKYLGHQSSSCSVIVVLCCQATSQTLQLAGEAS